MSLGLDTNSRSLDAPSGTHCIITSATRRVRRSFAYAIWPHAEVAPHGRACFGSSDDNAHVADRQRKSLVVVGSKNQLSLMYLSVLGSQTDLVARVDPLSERFGNGLSNNSSYVAYVVSNGSFKLRQNGIQFSLGLGGNSPLAQNPDPIF
jgi:hypothetical protein